MQGQLNWQVKASMRLKTNCLVQSSIWSGVTTIRREPVPVEHGSWRWRRGAGLWKIANRMSFRY